jgi:hypothetical protein
MNIFDVNIPNDLGEEAYNHLWDNAFDEDGELTEDPDKVGPDWDNIIKEIENNNKGRKQKC